MDSNGRGRSEQSNTPTHTIADNSATLPPPDRPSALQKNKEDDLFKSSSWRCVSQIKILMSRARTVAEVESKPRDAMVV